MIDATINAVNDFVTNRIKPFVVVPPQTGDEWANEQFYLPPDTSQIAGRWKSMHFQRPILNMMVNDMIQFLDVMKSARVGYTKMMTAGICYNICHRSRNQALWYPTDDQYEDYDKDELVSLYPHMPQLAEKFPWYNKKHSRNTLRLKKFLGSNLYLRGGQKGNSFRKFGISQGWIDEYDEFPLDVEGQGSPRTLAWKRSEGAPYRKLTTGCSPTIRDQSAIEAAFLSADVKLFFHIPCPKCGFEQDLKFGGRDTQFGLKWVDDDPTTVKYQCRSCHDFISQKDMMRAADEGGFYADMERTQKDGVTVWERTGIHTYDGIKFYDAAGNKIKTPRHVGVHIWTILNSMVSWVEIVQDWLKAKRDPLELKSSINTTLAETYDLKQGEKVIPKALRTRLEGYDATPLPMRVCLVTAGVDVQKDRFEVQFLGWCPGNEVYVLKYDIIKCDTSLKSSWDDLLDPALEFEFQTQSGVSVFAEAVGVDTGYETQRAYRFCLDNEHKTYLALKGMDNPTGKERPIIPLKPARTWGKAPAGLKGWALGSDTAKTVVMGMLSVEKPGENYVHFPDQGLPPDYFDQLTAETRIMKVNKSSNKRKYSWFLPSGKRNEALDTFIGALAAKEHLNVDLQERYETLTGEGSEDDVDWDKYFEDMNNG